MAYKDITGQKWALLTAGEFVGFSGKALHAKWCFKCECGNSVVALATNVKTGRTQSCGCHRTAARITHGESRTRTYQTWASMINRCKNPSHMGYRWYGGLGVKVCREWEASYQSFVEDMGHRPDGLTLDRIDPFGDYEPKNCRWATWETQRENKRRNAK